MVNTKNGSSEIPDSTKKDRTTAKNKNPIIWLQNLSDKKIHSLDNKNRIKDTTTGKNENPPDVASRIFRCTFSGQLHPVRGVVFCLG